MRRLMKSFYVIGSLVVSLTYSLDVLSKHIDTTSVPLSMKKF